MPGGTPERVTVNLAGRAVPALERAMALTGDSKTDTINRAVQVYAFAVEAMRNGGAVYVRPAKDAELERVRIF